MFFFSSVTLIYPLLIYDVYSLIQESTACPVFLARQISLPLTDLGLWLYRIPFTFGAKAGVILGHGVATL